MDTLFFISSKLGWALLSPDTLLVILGVGAWLAMIAGWTKAARQLLATLALLLVIIGTLPVGEWLAVPLETRFPTSVALPAEADGIVVLGGAIAPELSRIWGQIEIGEAAERLLGFQYLATVFPEATLLFTGGSGSVLQQEFKEADSARLLLDQLGLGPRDILFESAARNTLENARNAKALAQPQPDEEWILITSAAHMPRAVGTFCQQGWEVTAYPVDHSTHPGQLWRLQFEPAHNLSQLRSALREWASLLAYYVSGYSGALFPGPGSNCAANGNVAISSAE